jgi:methylenetetrahydrofolate dehydrogenase (NADP+)/methenyltetrahydrofolate cyclohydrolase
MILAAKPVTTKIYTQVAQDIKNLKSKNITPSLAVILVGENPASLSYVKVKDKIAQKYGIDFKLFHFPGFSSDRDVLKMLDSLNKDEKIQGIVVQLPLPEKFDTQKIISQINPQKDIDGLFSKIYPSPAAGAILEILNYYNIDFESKNKKIVVVGLGSLVGKPLVEILNSRAIYPIVCTSTTGNLASETIDADIVVSATGQPGLITAEMVSEKATVIDAGTAVPPEVRQSSNGKIIGDVDKSIYSKIANYSPVPGGVGPITVACLMRNLIEATKKQFS